MLIPKQNERPTQKELSRQIRVKIGERAADALVLAHHAVGRFAQVLGAVAFACLLRETARGLRERGEAQTPGSTGNVLCDARGVIPLLAAGRIAEIAAEVFGRL